MNQNSDQKTGLSSNQVQKNQNDEGPLADFFTNENSPYHSCPEKIKSVFLNAKQGDKLDPLKINLSQLAFEPKPTRVNFCTSIMTKIQQQYFTCDTCKVDKIGTLGAATFCRDCFEPQKHKEHKYEQAVNIFEYTLCQCGRTDFAKQESFCAKHAKFNEQVQCSIPQGQGKQFIHSMVWLLQSAVYCEMDTQILTKIKQYLISINGQSVFYNRLTFQVLSTPSKYLRQQEHPQMKNLNYFYFILLNKVPQKVNRKWALSTTLTADLQTRKLLIKFICKLIDQRSFQQIINMLSPSFIQQLLNKTVLKKLEEEKFSHRFITFTPKDNQFLEFQKKVFEEGLAKSKNIQDIMTLLYQIHVRVYIFNYSLLFKLIEFFPNTEQQVKRIRQKLNIFQPQKLRLDFIFGNVDPKLLIFSEIMLKSMDKCVRGNMDKQKDIRQFICENNKQISVQKLDSALEWLILCQCFQILSTQAKQINKTQLICLLILIRGSKKQKQFVKNIWYYLLWVSNQTMEQTKLNSKIQIASLLFDYVIKNLVHADMLMCLDKGIKTQEEQQFFRRWFRGYLCNKKFIPLIQILRLREQKFLSFKGAAQILNELCEYYEEEEYFHYISSHAYSNIAHKWPVFVDLNKNQKYNSNVNYKDKNNIEDSLSKQLIQLMFSTDTVAEFLEQNIAIYLQTKDKIDIPNLKSLIGFEYLYMLVSYNIFNNQNNKEVKRKLQEFKTNEQLLKKYSINDRENYMLRRLMGLTQQQQEQHHQIEQNKPIVTVDKQKFKRKKQKMMEKYRKNQQHLLQNLSSSLINSKQEQRCIICHERESKNSQFVYLSYINKGNTVASAICGNFISTKTYIKTCFHCVHVECFMGIKWSENNLSFKCPLCHCSCNCILPIKYKLQNEKLNSMCEQSIKATLFSIFKVFDFENLFMLIFKHLIESKGWNNILTNSRKDEHEKKMRDKNDDYLEQIMIKIYEVSNEKVKFVYKSHIQRYVNEQYFNLMMPQIVEVLFAESYIFKLNNHQSNNLFEEAMNRGLLVLRPIMNEGEFGLMKEQLEKIISFKIKLKQPTQQQNGKVKEALSSKLVEPPLSSSLCYQKYYPYKCSKCQNIIAAFICFICNDVYCQTCNGDHLSNTHSQTAFYLYLGDLSLTFQRKDYSMRSHLYYNEFKIPFIVGANYEAMKEDNYALNKVKFESMAKKFYEY